MVYLGHRLSVQKVGHLMSVPVRLKDHGTVGGIVILSPYTMRTWNDDDQTRLTELAESTASYLQQFDALQLAQDELQHVRNAFQDIKLEKDSVLAEKQTLLARIQELQVMASTEQTQGEDLTTLQEELRLALQEIAILNADQGVSRASENGAELTRDDFAEIVAVAEELRQPMSSLVGYTDVLLAESHGILGERQRKIVERIRVANERMTRLLDELIGNLNIEDTQFKHAKLQETDLATAIQTAITETEPVRQARQIGVRIKLPDKMPPLQANPVALHKVLDQLLTNASRVSAPDTNIFLHAQVRAGDGEHDFVLLQISDTGNGISHDEYPHIFSHVSGAGAATTNGMVNDTGLVNVKSLVESFGGRVLLDSEPGRGATFSLLLPVKAT